MKRPVIGDTVILGAKVNDTHITAIYDGVKLVKDDKPSYSVKTTSGDIYDVLQDGNNWRAIR